MNGIQLHESYKLEGDEDKCETYGPATGGGHSTTGARYGLAADLVIDMTVVTPDGKVVTTNAIEAQRSLLGSSRRRHLRRHTQYDHASQP